MTPDERAEFVKQLKVKRELWLRGNLEWKMHSGQRKVYDGLKSLDPKVREAVVFISRRWGKSYLGVLLAIQKCLEKDGAQVFIVAPTIKQSTRILQPLIQEIIADAPLDLIKRTKSEHTWTIGKSTLFIGGFDTAIESFRGLRADLIIIEESGMANSEEYEYTINSVLRPTLQHSRGRIIHLTTPAKAIDHPLHSITIPNAQMQEAFFKYTIYDNPLLTTEEIESEIASMGGIDSVHVRRELFCELVKDAQSLVIPEFNSSYVVSTPTPRHTMWLTSIDFGGSRDKTSIISGYYDFERAKVVVKGSKLLDPNTGTDIVVAECIKLEESLGVKWKEGEKRVCDAHGQTHVDIRNLGFKCFLPVKGRDSVEEGINALRVEFLRGNIEIDPAAKELIVTLENGQWNDNRTDFRRTKELGHCDAIAAMVYFLRHINKSLNPFPVHEGLSRETHYLPIVERDTDTETALNTAFTL